MQQANVYRFSVLTQSEDAMGDHVSDIVDVIAPDVPTAQAILAASGGPFISVQGPTQLSAGALTSMDTSVQTVQATITPAQFKAMDGTTPTSVQILPAPGPGLMYVVDSCETDMQFPASGGVAYATGTGNLLLGADEAGVLAGWYCDSSGIMGAAMMKNTRSSFYRPTSTAYFPGGGQNVTDVGNRALAVNVSSSTKYTAGNSPFLINIRYRIVTAI